MNMDMIQLEDEPEKEPGKKEHPLLNRAERVFGPVIAGLILDFVDLATFGPIGLMFGGIIGFAAGFWICRIYRLAPVYRFIGASTAALYCMMPATEIFPIATLVGVFVRFFEKPVGPAAEENIHGNEKDRNDEEQNE